MTRMTKPSSRTQDQVAAKPARSRNSPPRTFEQMVQSTGDAIRTVDKHLGITYRTYKTRCARPSTVTLEEIRRLAIWLNEPYDQILEELKAEAAVDPDVFTSIQRHPKGIDRRNPKNPNATGASANIAS